MANDSRATRKVKEDKVSNSKEKRGFGKSLTSSSPTSDCVSGLRRSSREIPSRENTITRKSERLEVRALSSPPDKKKSIYAGKQNVSSPLKRLEIIKKQSPLSKKPDGASASSITTKNRRRSEKQLEIQTKTSGKNQKFTKELSWNGKNRIHARAYRALFKQQPMKEDLSQSILEEPRKDSVENISRNAVSESSSSVGSSAGAALSPKEGCDKCINLTQKIIKEANFSDNWGGTIREVDERHDHESCKHTFIQMSIGDTRGADEDLTLEVLGSDWITCAPVVYCREANISDNGGREGFESGGNAAAASAPSKTSFPHLNISGVDREHEGLTIGHLDTNLFPSTPGLNEGDGGSMTLPSKKEIKMEDVVYGAPSVVSMWDISPIAHDATAVSVCSVSEMHSTCFKRQRREIETDDTAIAEHCIINVQREEYSQGDQLDSNETICCICRLSGNFWICQGRDCKRSYHTSCVDLQLKGIPPGVWYCPICVCKKIESGEHSVSEGIESMWNAREVEIMDGNELRMQKQFFVKYKGLAHVHNQWIPESQLLLEAPSLLATFNRKSQAMRWKKDWTIPQRLLLKRSLTSSEKFFGLLDKPDTCIQDCHFEWLVKWCGLGYEHSTWELDTNYFMNLPKIQILMKAYENRLLKVKQSHFLSKKDELSVGFSTFLESCHSQYTDMLREYWHMGRNAVIIDDQFIHLAPSVDAVSYSGNNDVRRSVRTVEFYGEGGGLMFQVLAASFEVIIEDLDILQSISWETVIVDECQRSTIYLLFDKFKALKTNMWILLVNAQLKDNIIQHLLPLLDCNHDSNGPDNVLTKSNQSSLHLREQISKFIIVDGKLVPSRFLEYWVPVPLSDIQLEQYCANLLSNSFALRSSSKNDPVGVLRDTLISSRKCCDHPYIVDPLLQPSLLKVNGLVDILEIGIKASGKLQMLDVMLHEIRNRNLRVLILFQSSGGSGKDNIGDILDDFVRQRFGLHCYERIDSGVIPSKKHSALQNFNCQKGRFIFLLETRACFASIKLVSVDTVIIFGSDWSPLNDLRNLQKITLNSNFKQIKVFRLFSFFTAEEGVLILAKQDKSLDSNLQSITPSTSHILLMSGSAYLFDRLTELHDVNGISSGGNSFSEKFAIADIIQEFATVLCQMGKENSHQCFKILEVEQNQGRYHTKFPLPGEEKSQLGNEELPRIFWKKLLDGKKPRWIYSSGSPFRIRKRVRQFDSLMNPLVRHDFTKKHRKADTIQIKSSIFMKPALDGENKVAEAEGTSDIQASNVLATMHVANNISEVHEENINKFTKIFSQNDLYIILKSKMEKLYQILLLQEDVKDMTKRFLEYVMNNHHVSREPATILQAFQISLCWIGTSLLKQKLDRKESLALAIQHLNFECKKEEVDYVYSKLRCLKKLFLYNTSNFAMASVPNASRLSSKDQGLAQEDLSKGKEDSERICHEQLGKLLAKQQREKEELDIKYNEEKAQLEKKQRAETAVIRLHSNASMRIHKLKLLDIEYAKKFEELKCRMKRNCEELMSVQLDAQRMLHRKKVQWEDGANSWTRYDVINHHDTGNDEDVISSEEEFPAVGLAVPEYGNSRDEWEKAKHGTSSLGNPCYDEVLLQVPNSSFQIAFSEIASCSKLENVPSMGPPLEKQSMDRPTSFIYKTSFKQGEGSVTCSYEKEAPSVCNPKRNVQLVVSDVAEVGDLKSIEEGNRTAGISNFTSAGGSKSQMDMEHSSLSTFITITGDVLNSGSTEILQDKIFRENRNAEDKNSEFPDKTTIANQQDGEVTSVSACAPVEAAKHTDINEDEFYQDGQRQFKISACELVAIVASDLHNTAVMDLPEVALPSINSPSIGTIEKLGNSSNDSSLSLPNHNQHVNQLSFEPATYFSQDLPVEVPVTQLRSHISNAGDSSHSLGIGNHSLQTAHGWQAPSHIFVDPLQNELERVRKEIDQTINFREEMKMHLISDCEKEIEAVVSQIRNKYEAMLQSLDSEFIAKKKNLDAYHATVVMNKVLAEAFRSKYMDMRKSVASSMQQEMASSTFTQQLLQLSSQRGATQISSIGDAHHHIDDHTPTSCLRRQLATAQAAITRPSSHVLSWPSSLSDSFRVDNEIRTKPLQPLQFPIPAVGCQFPMCPLPLTLPSPSQTMEFLSSTALQSGSETMGALPMMMLQFGSETTAALPMTALQYGLVIMEALPLPESYLSAHESLTTVDARTDSFLSFSLPLLPADLNLNSDSLGAPPKIAPHHCSAWPDPTLGLVDIVYLSDDD